MQFSPTPPGPLSSCAIIVTDMWITDGAPSSRIEDSNVFAKYQDPNTGVWTEFRMTRTSGGWTDGPGPSWDAHYAGMITITGVTAPSGSPEGSGPMSSTFSHSTVTILVRGMVTDNAGHYADSDPYTFNLSTSCPP